MAMHIGEVKELSKIFSGKICTILTRSSIKQNFTNEDIANFFTALIEKITENGIFAKDLKTGCASYFQWQHVIGIFEEQVITENNPEFKNIPKQKEAPLLNDASKYVNTEFYKNIINRDKHGI